MLVSFILTPDESGAKGGGGAGEGEGWCFMPSRNARNPPYLLLPRGIEFIAGKNNPDLPESVSVVRISLQRFRDFGTNLPNGFLGLSVSRKGVCRWLLSHGVSSRCVSPARGRKNAGNGSRGVKISSITTTQPAPHEGKVHVPDAMVTEGLGLAFQV